jgi:hypothetical protein
VLTIGELDGPVTNRVRRVAAALGAVGEVTVTNDVTAHLWSKLARNAMTNGFASLTGGTTRSLWSDAMYQPIVTQVAAEAAAVAAAAGVTLEPIAGRIPVSAIAALSSSTPLMVGRSLRFRARRMQGAGPELDGPDGVSAYRTSPSILVQPAGRARSPTLVQQQPSPDPRATPYFSIGPLGTGHATSR